MQKNRAGLGVLRQIVDQIVVIDIHAIAEGQEVGKPHPPGKGPVYNRTGNGAGLAYESNPSRDRAHVGIGGVQATCRNHQTNRVGAEHTDPGFPGGLAHGIHQRLTGFTVSTGHATGHDNSGAHPGFPEPLDGLGHSIRRRADDGQIRGKVHFGDFLDAGYTVHVVVIVLVDHQQAPRITAPHQVPQYHAAKIVCPLRRTDHRNGRGIEKALQIPGAQADSPM